LLLTPLEVSDDTDEEELGATYVGVASLPPVDATYGV
jgi:hypothetical protein